MPVSRRFLGLVVVAVALAAFGWWGTGTAGGRRRFDEMAGIVPMLSLWAGGTLGVVAVVWLAVSALRNR